MLERSPSRQEEEDQDAILLAQFVIATENWCVTK